MGTQQISDAGVAAHFGSPRCGSVVLGALPWRLQRLPREHDALHCGPARQRLDSVIFLVCIDTALPIDRHLGASEVDARLSLTFILFKLLSSQLKITPV